MKRGPVLRTLLVLSFGLTALLIGLGPDSYQPGPRSTAHATLDDCSHCHAAADVSNGLLAGLVGHSGSDAERCLDCHDAGDRPFAAHGAGKLPPAAAAGPATWQTRMAKRLVPATDLSCARCHQEHQGRDHNLTVLADHRCQTCHAQAFRNFGRGHPAIQLQPQASAIHFDHRSHWRQHLPEEQTEPPACSQCHTLAPDGGMLRAPDFAQGCASCHAADIAGRGLASARGIAWMTLPGLDTAALRAAGLMVGHWPYAADAAADQLPAPAPDGLPENWLDLRAATPDQTAGLAEWIWQFKARLQRWAREGQPAIINDLGLERPEELGQIPVAVLAQAVATWFPQLDEELRRHRAGLPLPSPSSRPTPAPTPAADNFDALFGGGLLGAAPAPSPTPAATHAPRTPDSEARMAHGGWYLDGFSIRYRPSLHADPWLQRWSESADPQWRQDKTPGRCAWCHQAPAAGEAWNWKADTTPRSRLHRFRHQPHLSVVADGCRSCHQLAKDNAATQWRDLTLTDCVSCHHNEGAGQTCLQCHGYHEHMTAAPETP